jgi:hypothetical protein
MNRIPSKSVHHGLNADNVGLRDDRYVRCTNCGFVCHLDRDLRAPFGSKTGQGRQSYPREAYDDSGTEYSDTDTHYDGGINDFTITGGCPFCGSYTYDRPFARMKKVRE